MTFAELSVAFLVASSKVVVRLLGLAGDIVEAGASISCVSTFGVMPIRYPSTRACRVLSVSGLALAIGVCQGDCSETVKTDVSRFPSASGSIIVTNRTGGPPPIGSTWVVTGACVVELLIGSGTVSIPGMLLLLSLLAVFSTS